MSRRKSKFFKISLRNQCQFNIKIFICFHNYKRKYSGSVGKNGLCSSDLYLLICFVPRIALWFLSALLDFKYNSGYLRPRLQNAENETSWNISWMRSYFEHSEPHFKVSNRGCLQQHCSLTHGARASSNCFNY